MKVHLSLLLLLVAVCFSACHQADEPAKLVFDPDSVDLGIVIIGDSPKEFDVKLKNKGGKKLIIHRVETSCDCTTIDYPHDSIDGGSTATMHVTFDGKDFFPSEMVREIQVFSNDMESPKTFYFKVKVQYGSVRNDSCETYNIYSHS